MDCQGIHRNNGHTGIDMYDVLTIAGRRYTVCAHQLPSDSGQAYCGALIDVTDGQVTICCASH